MIELKRIAFTINAIGFAGVETATLKLADALASLHGFDAVLCFIQTQPTQHYLVRIHQSFPKIRILRSNPVCSSAELKAFCESENVDVVYTQIGSPEIPSIFHSVLDRLFSHCVCQSRPLQSRWFTYTSQFLAKSFSDNSDNYLPYIVNLPDHSHELRGQLGIPPNAKVFGRLGGQYSWNIRFVDALLSEYSQHRRDAYFLFANTPKIWPYMDDSSRFLHIGAIVFDEVLKRAFVNTCDAMIHARSEGETFGLACAEFAFANRPVITYAHSPEKAHLEMLGDLARPYDSPASLWYALDTATEARGTDSAYKHFSEAVVTKRFMDMVNSPS